MSAGQNGLKLQLDNGGQSASHHAIDSNRPNETISPPATLEDQDSEVQPRAKKRERQGRFEYTF